MKPWMQLFAIRKKPAETYVDFYRRVEAARSKIDRVTPPDLTSAQRSEELGLFTVINGLDVDDPLRRQFVIPAHQTGDRGETIKTETIESAKNSFLCRYSDHFTRNCRPRQRQGQEGQGPR